VPGTGREKIRILRLPDKIRLLKNRETLTEYALPAVNVKGEHIKPDGVTVPPPRNSKKPTGPEESRLRAIAPEVAVYLEVIKKLPQSSSIKKYQMIRQLFRLSQKLSPALFIKVIERAHGYGVTDMETIERIAAYQLHYSSYCDQAAKGDGDLGDTNPYPELDVSDLPDLSRYDTVLDDNEEPSDG
jgi:hypothetical protein